MADAFQVRSIAEERLVERVGRLDGESMAKIDGALMVSLGLGESI